MEGAGSYKMLVTVCKITCRYISEDGVLYSCHCENLKSYLSLLFKKEIPCCSGSYCGTEKYWWEETV